MNMFSGITARRLYICTSTRNLAAYRRLQQALELSRYEVLDWTRFLPAPGPGFDQRKNEDPHGAAFAFCSRALGSADLIAYIGPGGCDASAELGMAFASGVPVWGVLGPNEQPGVMIKGCVARWFPTLDALIDKLTRWRGW